MTPVEFAAEVRRQLERVLESRGFTRNERLSRFLRFLVERHLEGRDGQLKESVIGTAVFGRRPDYNPKQDAIVRTEAGRLRARISEYYKDEGKADPLIIEVPKGGYVPVLSRADKVAGRQKTSLLWRWGAVGIGVALIASLLTLWLTHRDVPITIAVLPLENVSRDPSNEYLADGLTDELIRNLSIIEGLVPRSRTSSFTFKGKQRSVREAGEQLHAEYIVEGSVLRSGQKLRIIAQLVRVRDDFPIWSGKYDREVNDIFMIQDEISRGIVNSLRLKLGRGRRRYETSAEAYDLYLRASTFEFQQGTVGIDESVGSFERVIAKDPSFAPA